MTTVYRIVSLAAFAVLIGSPRAASAQAPLASTLQAGRNALRADLEAMATQLDRFAVSSAYSEKTRAKARAEAAQVRRRLTEGDFQVGDRLIINVEGSVAVIDTVSVLEGRRIMVKGIRQVSLAGILRSELETKLLGDLTEVVRNATVSARPLMRVAVFGAVAQPGYLTVPMESTLDAVITLAGGPTPTAEAEATKLVRADTVLLKEREVTLAIASGRTLDDLGLRDGDALVVPTRGAPWDRGSTIQIASFFLTPLLAAFVFRR